MPTIASIRPSGAATVITLDDHSDFRCTREFAARSRLSRGQQIDAVILERLRQQASFDLAYSEAARLLRKQKYSCREIAQRLSQSGCSRSDIRVAIDELAPAAQSDISIAASLTHDRWRRESQRDGATSWQEFRRRQAGRLAMRGFSPGAISAALAEVREQHDAASLARD